MKLAFSLLMIIIASLAIPVYSQDNNNLARVAYEDAEAALSSGDYLKAIEQLNKVNNYLGKVTPKAQYLAVQAWNMAAANNPVYFDNAMTAGKVYLDLSKSYELPEEKVLEITRLLQKLQSDKNAYAENVKRTDNKKWRAQELARLAIHKLDEFILNEYQLKLNEPIDSFEARRPAVAKLKKDKYSRGVYDKGIYAIGLSGRRNDVTYYAENFYVGKSDQDAIKTFTELSNKIDAVFSFLSELGTPEAGSTLSQNFYKTYYKDEKAIIKLSKSQHGFRLIVSVDNKQREIEYKYKESWPHHTRATVDVIIANYRGHDNEFYY